MLTISQLAAYAGVTVRTVRHYHQQGLLAEPARDASGYRRYDGQAVADLLRVRTLAASGVPLTRVKDLLDSPPEEFARALDEIDRDLEARIADLERHRKQLAELEDPERLCLPDVAADHLARVRDLGFSERMLRLHRDGWILLAAVYPDQLDAAVRDDQRRLDNPAYVALMHRYDEALDWDPGDPRLRAIAEDAVTLFETFAPESETDLDEVAADQAAYGIVSNYGVDAAPSWIRINELIEEIALERGIPL